MAKWQHESDLYLRWHWEWALCVGVSVAIVWFVVRAWSAFARGVLGR